MSSSTVRVSLECALALAVIMEVARCETPGKLSNELYAKTMKRCCMLQVGAGELLGSWGKEVRVEGGRSILHVHGDEKHRGRIAR